MRGLILLTLLIANVYSQLADDAKNLNPSGCGRRINQLKDYSDSDKILGGNRANPEDWGWQVAMNYSGRFICGGSLINSQWVLTAAHCLYGRLDATPIFYSFDIGHHDRANLESWATTRDVSKFLIHPNFNSRTLENDIALIKLSSPVTYSRQIVPVCVPDGSYDYAGKQSWATGWGTLSSGGSVSRYLMEVQMPFLTDARCKQKFSIVNTSIAVCAGETGENKDTCQGDSGGPLVVQHVGGDERWYVSGITSWGYGCGDGGVYTRTSYYYNWILAQIRRY